MQARTGAGAAPTAPAFVRRQIPVYELVGEEGLALIESKADELLAEIGIEVHDDVACRMFADAGATVDGQRVRFDPGHVRSLCRNGTVDVHAAGSQPGALRRDRRRRRRVRSRLRLAVRP